MEPLSPYLSFLFSKEEPEQEPAFLQQSVEKIPLNSSDEPASRAFHFPSLCLPPA